MSRHGQRYSCRLPTVPEVRSDTEEEETVGKELFNVSSLLEALSDGTCLTKVLLVLELLLDSDFIVLHYSVFSTLG